MSPEPTGSETATMTIGIELVASFAASLKGSGRVPEETYPVNLPRLLRARRERPRSCCAADERDERAALHSITSSARTSMIAGTGMPSAFAVFWLITSSNLVGCSTGKSAGLAPLTILST
jgi:hypothetical protein